MYHDFVVECGWFVAIRQGGWVFISAFPQLKMIVLDPHFVDLKKYRGVKNGPGRLCRIPNKKAEKILYM